MALEVIKEIENVGGYYNDPSFHFVYKSGKHGQAYLNMDPLFPHARIMYELCQDLAAPIGDLADVIVGAATGGIPLATTVGFILDAKHSVWADKVGDGFAFEREGFAECVNGKSVWYVEDVLNTGDTTLKVIEVIEDAGGILMGVSVACNRGGLTKTDLGVRMLHELSSISLEAFTPDACPGCRDEVPVITDIGHGDKYEAWLKEQSLGNLHKFVKLRS